MMLFILLLLPWGTAIFTPEPYGRWFAVGAWSALCGFIMSMMLMVFFLTDHEDRWWMAGLTAYYWFLYWVFC